MEAQISDNHLFLTPGDPDLLQAPDEKEPEFRRQMI